MSKAGLCLRECSQGRQTHSVWFANPLLPVCCTYSHADQPTW